MYTVHIVASRDKFPVGAGPSGFVKLGNTKEQGVQFIAKDEPGFFGHLARLFEECKVDRWLSDVELPAWILLGLALNKTDLQTSPTGNRICIVNTKYHKVPVIYVGINALEIHEDLTGLEVFPKLNSFLEEEFHGYYKS